MVVQGIIENGYKKTASMSVFFATNLNCSGLAPVCSKLTQVMYCIYSLHYSLTHVNTMYSRLAAQSNNDGNEPKNASSV